VCNVQGVQREIAGTKKCNKTTNFNLLPIVCLPSHVCLQIPVQGYWLNRLNVLNSSPL
jgi:hypothetical protein